MHVAYIITKLELGGAQKVCLSLREGLQRDEISVSLISGREGPLVPDVEGQEGIHLITSIKREIGFFSIFREVKAFLKVIKTLRKIRKENKNCVAHTHSTKAGVFGRWAAFFAGIKHRVHTVHGFGFHADQSKLIWLIVYLFELFTAPITSHFVCVSSADRKLGSKILPFFKRRSSVIRAAVDFHIFQKSELHKFPQGKDPFIIGTVSCFKPQKNLLDLVEAFAIAKKQIPGRALELHVLGDGVMRPQIEAKIKSFGIEKEVKLLGWQSDVAKHLHGWHLMAMSSLWEGLPCAVVEARLSKIPVVAYDVGGIYEIIKDNKNGFLINPKDIKGLAVKLARVASDEITYKSMCRYGDDLDGFSLEKMVAQHEELYRRLTGEIQQAAGECEK
ncbi:glycosyltransferase family 4 protein [bacterium]|nr:glycosyltransferase family 4 protein [bacterium]